MHANKRTALKILIVAMLGWQARAATAIDDPAAQTARAALKTAARILAEYSETKEAALIQAICAAGPLFHPLKASTQLGQVTFTNIRMNANADSSDGVRFITPSEDPSYMLWVFSKPTNLPFSWRLVSTEGTIVKLRGTYRVRSSADFIVPWPANTRTVIQGVWTQPLKPDCEYLVHFYFKKNIPVDMYFGLYLLYFNVRDPKSLPGRTYTVAGRFDYRLDPGECELEAFGIFNTNLPPAALLKNAIKASDIEFIDYALSLGAKINDGSSLCLAVLKAADPDTIKHLIKRGADVNSRSSLGINDGETPLHLLIIRANSNIEDTAAGQEARTIAEILVKHGADINAREPRSDDSPLMAAIRGYRPILALKLIALGADITLTNNQGETALDLARAKQYTNVVAVLEAKH